MSTILFIDTNQYLSLYGLTKGKPLLDAMDEQKEHIFVTPQIADEVQRRKLGCAQVFLSDKLKEVAALKAPIPDHLLGISDEKIAELRKDLQQAERARDELTRLTAAALTRISNSEDEVSARLKLVFNKRMDPTDQEIERARNRKERGNPPGKPDDPLGDQITWEQLLSYVKSTRRTRLWLVTNDRDFCVKNGKQLFLNAFLRQDLSAACDGTWEIYCFPDLMEGIQHFGKHAGVRAEKLPSEKQAAEISKELSARPSFGRIDDGTWAAIINAQHRRGFNAALGTSSGFVLVPFEQGRGGIVDIGAIPSAGTAPQQAGSTNILEDSEKK